MYTSSGPELEVKFIWTFPVNGIPVQPSQQLVMTEVNGTTVVETSVALGPRTTVGAMENVAAVSSKQENSNRA